MDWRWMWRVRVTVLMKMVLEETYDIIIWSHMDFHNFTHGNPHIVIISWIHKSMAMCVVDSKSQPILMETAGTWVYNLFGQPKRSAYIYIV